MCEHSLPDNLHQVATTPGSHRHQQLLSTTAQIECTGINADVCFAKRPLKQAQLAEALDTKQMTVQPEPLVSHSSPLIALATVGRLQLLKSLFGEVAIPQAVHEEVVVQGQGEPGSKEVAEAEWIRTILIKDQLAADVLQESLDMGESEAIVLGQELRARYVLLDDELARRKADLIGLPVAGTLAVLLMAKRAG
jgi:uncharacterized protein